MNIAYRAARKLYYLTIGKSPVLDRFFRYRGNPQDYWVKRGGQTYFEEQEAVEDRTQRSQFIAQEIKQISFGSLLEIGCGYSKQLKSMQSPGMSFFGCDFSRPQLLKGKEFFPSMVGRVAEADAEFLPFKDKSFDVVMSSAVILHNKHPKAKRIIAEMIRVSRKYLVHNEDMDITFSRYGYNLTKTYAAMGFKIVASKEIPCSQDPEHTQFTIAEISSPGLIVRPEEVALRYHKD
ncbi:MAG: class I SAM-dependent methyltransferase [Candidatus Omnitrophota bacterium]